MKNANSILESIEYFYDVIKIDSYNFKLYRFKVWDAVYISRHVPICRQHSRSCA